MRLAEFANLVAKTVYSAFCWDQTKALLAGSPHRGALFEYNVGPKGQMVLSRSIYGFSFSIGLCSLLFLTLMPSTVFAQTAQEIVAKARPAVVQVIALDGNWAPIKTGTGFFISADGDLLTNFHVIQGAAHISARTDKGAMFFFERLVAGSPESDVALLKFQATERPNYARALKDCSDW